MKKIRLGMPLLVFSLIGQVMASADMREEKEPDTTSFGRLEETQDPLLDQQIKEAQAYISLRKGPVNLALAVGNDEEQLEGRFDDSYIYLDLYHKYPSGKRGLTVDFNNLDQLKKVGLGLSEAFDTLILDGGSFHITQWTINHLQYFYRSLKPEGRFIFAPFITTAFLMSEQNCKSRSEGVEIVRKEVRGSTELVRGYSLPFDLSALQEKDYIAKFL